MYLASARPRTRGDHDSGIWTSDLVAAQAAFGQTARLHVIRHLRLNGPGTRSEIVDGTLIGHGLVGQCLNKLKSLGIVIDDATPGNLPARDRTYTLDHERTDHLLRTMKAFISVGGM